MSSPRAAHAQRKIDISCLPRLGIRAPDLPLVRIVVEAVDVVVEVGDEAVSGNVALSGRRQDFVEFFGGEVELIQFVGVAGIMASQMFPSLSIVIMRLPVGKPGFDTGTG